MPFESKLPTNLEKSSHTQSMLIAGLLCLCLLALAACVTDIRYKGSLFPLQSSDSEAAATIRRKQGDREGCDPNNPCAGVDCPGLSVCQDYWRMPYCV